ncbi:MAG: hypothetical protein H6Q89_1944 [Myxococcaceae bacterium]|nr:hypothetical protein [Myxococcaceae bacterium]
MPETLPSVADINEDIARGLKRDGHSASVVTRKLMDVHQVTPVEARQLVAKVFGGAAAVHASNKGQTVVIGITLIAAGLTGGALVYFAVGFSDLELALPLYALAFGAFSGGLTAILKVVLGDTHDLKAR